MGKKRTYQSEMKLSILLIISASVVAGVVDKPKFVLLGDPGPDTTLVIHFVASILERNYNRPEINHGSEYSNQHIKDMIVPVVWPPETFKLVQIARSIAEDGDVRMIIAVHSLCATRIDLLAISSYFSLPVILLPSNACLEEPSHLPANVIYLGPPLLPLMRFILNYMEMKGFDSFVIILDKVTEAMVGSDIEDALFSTHIIVYSGEELMDTNSTLYHDVEQDRDRHGIFIAVLSASNYQLFNKAHDLELLSPVQSWVVVNIDSSMSLVSSYFHHTDVVSIIDARRHFQKFNLQYQDRLPFYNTTDLDKRPFLYDLDFVISSYLSTVISKMKPGYSSHSFTGPALIKYLRSETALEMCTSHMHALYMDCATYINPYTRNSISFVQSFSGFNGKVFNITTLENKLFQIRKSDGTFEGVAFDLLNELKNALNFSYIITFPPDGQWGSRQKDGTWGGMIGMVMRRELDFAVGSFTVTAGREEVIDYTFPYWQSSAGMIMRTSSASSNKLLVYLHPFKLAVWLCVIATIPLGATALWLMTYIAYRKARLNRKALFLYDNEKKKPKIMQNGTLGTKNMQNGTVKVMQNGSVSHQDHVNRFEHRGSESKHTPGFLLFFLLIFGQLWQQSLPWLPKFGAGRWMVGSLWIVSVVMAATYTGNLIAFLAVPKVTVPVDTLDDLARQTKYSVGLVQGQALEDIFKNAQPNSLYNRIWKQISLSDKNIVPKFHEGWRKVVNENFIYLDDTKNLASIQIEEADAGNCSMYIAKEKFYSTGYAFPLQTKSPYKHIFNEKILGLLSSGVIDKWMRKYKPSIENKCGGMERPGVEPVSLEDTIGLFYFLILGTSTSLVILILEYTCRKLHSNNGLLFDEVVKGKKKY